LGSYRLIEKVFKWLALALLAYIGAALFARPDIVKVLAGSLIPTIRLDPASSASSWHSLARRYRRISSSGRRARKSRSRSASAVASSGIGRGVAV